MQWWNDFVDWLSTSEGSRIVSTTILPFLAILVAGIVAALIARGAISRLLSKQERAERASAVEALIAVGERASQWSGLSNQTREHFEAQSSVASIRVRLLPAPGSAMASAWAEYQLADIKRNSANFSVQADQGYAEYRDRLIEWHHRPAKARRIFAQDLERFRIDAASDDVDLIERQRRWKADQATAQTQAQAAPQTQTAAQTQAPAASNATPTTRIPVVPATPSAPSYVPPAPSRVYAPRNPTGATDVVEATIDDDSTITSK
jgi:murein DD-endopeptidase MepM/ murein hydrolase activator NlpD